MESLEAEVVLQPPVRPVLGDSSPVTPRIQSPHHHHHGGHHSRLGAASRPHTTSILTRFHAGYFRISLSLASQALLLKILTQGPTTASGSGPSLSSTPNPSPAQSLGRFLHAIIPFPSVSCLLLWLLALLVQFALSLLYVLRCCFHFHMVKAEFFHHVGVNYLFAPWISWLVLLQASPAAVPKTVSYLAQWWAFAFPVIALDLKIYGQWFTTEKRFLSMVANPTSQISVIGNLVGARAAALMGWKESSVCMFSLGMAHYLVLFVTLYQRLSGGDRLPAMLRPVFFLFFAAPSMASLAWTSISGAFDTGSKMLFFLSLFLFASLACRPALFKKSMKKFNVAWWAYSFPLAFLALASAEYAQEVQGAIAYGLMLILSALTFTVFLGLALLTGLNTRMILQEDDPILRFDKDTRSRN